jgi:hypothetical protein
MLLLVYLEHLQNEFQLQRLLCRQQRCASDALIDISMRMLTAAMILPSIQIDSINIHRDRAWIVSSHPRTFLPMSITRIALVLCAAERRRHYYRPSHAHAAKFQPSTLDIEVWNYQAHERARRIAAMGVGAVWRQPRPVRRSGKDAVVHFGRDSRQLRPEERDEHERRRTRQYVAYGNRHGLQHAGRARRRLGNLLGLVR